MIKTLDLVKTYKNGQNEFKVLKGIDLVVNKKDFLTITGRSGSGKSTLLYQMSLLDKPTSGTVLIDEIDTRNLSTSERINLRLNRLGYIFQDYAILPELTAVENVMLPLLMQGHSYDLSLKKSMNALDKVKLSHRPNNLPSQLSGGEQQRVSIARAVAHDPDIIFADEPTANLDSETAEIIMETFVNLNKDGQTIVMVTHEPEYTEIGNRTIFLNDGLIVDSEIN